MPNPHPDPLHAQSVAASRAGMDSESIAFLIGGFGVLSGFSIFFLMLDKADSPLLFLGILGVASVLSAIFEGLRERIEHGHVETGTRSAARLLLVIVVLISAEIHGMSWESLTTVASSREILVVVHAVLGSSITGSASVWLDLVVLLGFWVVSGALLALVLLRQQGLAAGTLGQRIRRGAWHGAAAGALIAPAGLLAYVMLVWVGRGLYLMLLEPETWLANLTQLQTWAGTTSGWFPSMLGWSFTALYEGVTWLGPGSWLSMLVVVGGVALVVQFVRMGADVFAWILGGALAAALIAPLLLHLDALFVTLLRASLVWFVPGLVLGAVAPLLRETAAHQRPQVWGLVAFASAAVLCVITLFRFSTQWWLLGPAVLLFTLGLAVRRAPRVDEFWLPMALAMGVLVGGATLGVQSAASFVGVYDGLHGLTTLPSEIRRPEQVGGIPEALREFLERQRARGTRSGAVPLPQDGASLAARLERTRKAHQELEDLRRERAAQPVDLAALALADARSADVVTAAEAEVPQRLMDSMERTIGSHRVVREQVDRLEELRRALDQQRSLVLAIEPPAFALSVRPAGADPAERSNHQEFVRLRGEVVAMKSELVAALDRDLATCASLASALEQRRGAHAATERAMRETIVRWLELALAGSVGYWTAISLLVGWSMQRRSQAAT